MKIHKRIAFYTTLIITGLTLFVLGLYHSLNSKAINPILNNENVTYKIGFYIGYYGFILIGLILIIISVKGLLSQIKKLKNT